MWGRSVGGRNLKFHLAGINNQNFFMKDEATGSWWQQVTGRAILGALRDAQLERISHDEVTFATWKKEHPETRVLKPDPAVATQYAAANWEEEIAELPVVTPRLAREPLNDRDLVVGV